MPSSADPYSWKRLASLEYVSRRRRTPSSLTASTNMGQRSSALCDTAEHSVGKRSRPNPSKDVTPLIPLIQAVPPIRGKRGQPLRRPEHLYADRGSYHEVNRNKIRRFQITPHL